MRCTVMFPFNVGVSSFNGLHCIEELLWSLFNSVVKFLQPFCNISSSSLGVSGLESCVMMSCLVDSVMHSFVSDRMSNMELLFAFIVNPSVTLKLSNR